MTKEDLDDSDFDERRQKLKQLFTKTRWIQLLLIGFAAGYLTFFALHLYALTVTMSLSMINLLLTVLMFAKVFSLKPFSFQPLSKRNQLTHKVKTEQRQTSIPRKTRSPCSECGSIGGRHFKTCSKNKKDSK